MSSLTLKTLIASRQLGRFLFSKSRPFVQFYLETVHCNSTFAVNDGVNFQHAIFIKKNAIKNKLLHSSALMYNVQRTVNCAECSHSYTSDASDFINLISCPKCGTLQKIDSSLLPNYFEILDQVKGYRVDQQSISNKTRQLQRKFHPDLFSQKSSDQQSLSQEYSSLINKALWTVSDPIARGRYLLTLAGISPDDPNSDLERTMTSDPEFLEEVMELNEKLEEISSESNWKQFRDENDETMKSIHGDLERAFDKEDIQEAQRLLGRLKYYDTLQHKLKELQSRIGVVE